MPNNGETHYPETKIVELKQLLKKAERRHTTVMCALHMRMQVVAHFFDHDNGTPGCVTCEAAPSAAREVLAATRSSVPNPHSLPWKF